MLARACTLPLHSLSKQPRSSWDIPSNGTATKQQLSSGNATVIGGDPGSRWLISLVMSRSGLDKLPFSKGGKDIPFELRGLEAALAACVNVLELAVRNLERVAFPALEGLLTKASQFPFTAFCKCSNKLTLHLWWQKSKHSFAQDIPDTYSDGDQKEA